MRMKRKEREKNGEEKDNSRSGDKNSNHRQTNQMKSIAPD
jgi:hypothetical protein